MCGDWPYLFATIVANTKILFDIADLERFFTLLKLRCDERFTHAFSACCCVFKEITLVGSNQGNFFEDATACSKRKLKTTVATQLKIQFRQYFLFFVKAL